MERVYLPTLHWFAMNNPFTGSWEAFRFRVIPKVVMATAKEVDFEASTMEAEYWHGPFCYEKSEMEGKETFPLTEQGRTEMQTWLESHIEEYTAAGE